MTERFPALSERRSGTLEIVATVLRFVFDNPADGEPFSLSLSRLIITVQGQNNIFYVMSDGGLKKVTTQSRALIERLAAMSIPAAQQALKGAKARSLYRWGPKVAIVATCLAALLAVPLLLAWIPSSWLNRVVSLEDEASIRRQVQRQLGLESSSGEAQQMVAKLVAGLARHAPGLGGINVDVAVEKSAEVNAFAVPGGLVVVNTALVEQAQSLDEVLGVLAHELGHVDLRHSLKAMVSGLGVLAGFGALSMMVGTELPALLFKGTQAYQLKFSRDHERDADAYALELLLRAGVSPGGFIDFLRRMQAREPDPAVGRVLTVTRTHPMSAERVAAVESRLAGRKPGAPFEAPFTLPQLKQAVAR